MSILNNMVKMLKFSCPKCQVPFSMEDINVSQNMGLCRACGYHGPFIGVMVVPELSDEELVRPPRGVRFQRGFDDQLVIVCRPPRTGLFLLIPFTVFWSGMALGILYVVPIQQGTFDWKIGLFSLPFVLGSIVLWMSILYGLFGRVRITLTRGRVATSATVWGIGRRQSLECGEDTQVRLAKSNYRVNDTAQPEIVVSSGGRKLKLGSLVLPKRVLPYIAGVLKRTLTKG